MKSKRKVDKKLLAEVRKRPCAACEEENGFGIVIDAHHLRSRAGGGPDEDWNVIPLDRFCHAHLHAIGPYLFAEKFPPFAHWLEEQGWSFDDRNRLTHPQLMKGAA